jgi:hypothetical protein
VTDHDCTTFDVDHPGARCTPSKNKLEEMLGTWKKIKRTQNLGSYEEGHFVCWKPWTIKENMSNNQYHAYELAWAKLEKSGYPRCLQTTAEEPKVEVIEDQEEEPKKPMHLQEEEHKPLYSAMPPITIHTRLIHQVKCRTFQDKGLFYPQLHQNSKIICQNVCQCHQLKS